MKRAGHVERMGNEKLADIRCPESGGDKEARKTRMRWKDCVRRDLERVGGQGRTTTADLGSWRPVIEDLMRE